MPEADPIFPELPTEVHGGAVAGGGKIDQSELGVLELDAQGLDAFDACIEVFDDATEPRSLEQETIDGQRRDGNPEGSGELIAFRPQRQRASLESPDQRFELRHEGIGLSEGE